MKTKEKTAQNIRELQEQRDALRTELDRLYVEVLGCTLEEDELLQEIVRLEEQMKSVREFEAEYRERDAERAARKAQQSE